MAEHRQQSRRSFIKRAAVIGGAATFGAGGIVAQDGPCAARNCNSRVSIFKTVVTIKTSPGCGGLAG